MKNTYYTYLFIITFPILLISYYINNYFYNLSNAKPLYEQQKQIEYKNEIYNLYPNGSVTSEGWARRAIWKYKRNYIQSWNLWIKEWDYYATYFSEYNIWIAITVSDVGYISLYSISLIDCNNKNYSQEDVIIPFTFGKTNLSSNSLEYNTININTTKFQIEIIQHSDRRQLYIKSLDFVYDKIKNKKGILEMKLLMKQPKELESINIQTTWAHNRHLFYLNEKVNGMISYDGFLKIGDKINNKIKENSNVYTVLDWGRGVWAYIGTWYWSSAFGKLENGDNIGFNLGYGFSDRSSATENCILYNNKLHKLGIVDFIIPKDEKGNFIYSDINKPWQIVSVGENRINLKFFPYVNRKGYTNVILIKTDQNQVFGYFKGYLILDNGKKIEINKGINGFAERVYNRW